MLETPLVDKLFIGGEWLGSVESGKTFDIVNPANDEVLGAMLGRRLAPLLLRSRSGVYGSLHLLAPE